jgi:hypothetical protein
LNPPLKRPSTIQEESSYGESSITSFRTAFTTQSSDTYKTAAEDSFVSQKLVDSFKKPAVKPFFQDFQDFEADSLMKSELKLENMSEDSLADESTIEISDDSSSSLKVEEKVDLNDTLEQFEFMMKQGAKLEPETKKHPLTPRTPHPVAKKPAPSTSGSKPLVPKAFAKLAPKTTPTFKKPTNLNTSRLPQPTSNSKFAHIVSPLSRYINSTPHVPLATNVHLDRKSGAITKLYSNRDSEASFKENFKKLDDSVDEYRVPSLPCRAKIGTSNKQVSFLEFLGKSWI